MQKASARPSYRPQTRVYRSLIAALLYFLGMVVLPSVHLGLHRNDHDHAAGGLHFYPAAVHHHGSGSEHQLLHLSDGADEPAEATEQASTIAPQSRDPLLLAVGLQAQGARVTVSFVPATPTAPSPSAPDHGSGSLAHFSCSYLASHDDLPRLPSALHVSPAPRQWASQYTPSSRLFGFIKARAPPATPAI